MLSRKGLIVNKSDLSSKDLSEIKSQLKVATKADFSCPYNSGSRCFQIYLESDKRLCIPRYYGLHVRKLQVTSDTSSQHVVHCSNLEFTGALNPSKQQDVAVRATLEAFDKCGGGILSLPTGYGKTVVALNVMCQVKVKTLIVVHKEFLLTQWEERIRQFVPLAKVGIIRQNMTDVQNKDVVLGMLQSIVMKEYEHDLFREFGLVVFDEVHHLSAPTFSKSLFKLCAPYILGLSATPERKDGLTWVMEYLIGKIFFRISRKNENRVLVSRYNYESANYYNDLPRLPNGKGYNNTQVVSLLTSDGMRTNYIVDIIHELLTADHGRKVLILSERRDHCADLKRRLNDRGKGTYTCDIYVGGMKPENLKKAELCDIIVATYSFANEGLDIGGLDTLLFATPKGDVVQSVGRILRDGGGSHGCKPPMVIDIVDYHSYFEQKFRKRKTFYKKSGFTILTTTNSALNREEDMKGINVMTHPQEYAFISDE